MTNDQREIHRKKRVLEYAERIANVKKACRHFGVARSVGAVMRTLNHRIFYREYLRAHQLAPINTARGAVN